jgi:hypothetical protein
MVKLVDAWGLKFQIWNGVGAISAPRNNFLAAWIGCAAT